MSPRTRLLVLTSSYPCHSGDPAGAFVAELARALVPHGFESRVVSLGVRGDGALAALKRGRLLSLAAATARMAARARRVEADAVLSHWLLPSALIGSGLGLPQVGVAHGGDARLLSHTPWLARRLVRRLDGLIAVSSEIARSLPGAPTLVAPMGVDRAEVGPPAPMPQGPLRLLFLGRLVPIKGLRTLLASLGGARLTVAGDGPERRLAASAPPGVRFIGAVPLEARRSLLAEHHVVCVPSMAGEGAPRVVGEAYAAGRPVLASDVGGLRDLVPAAWRVQPADVGAWGRAIAGLGADPASLEAPAPPDRLSWPIVSARIAGFLNRVLG